MQVLQDLCSTNNKSSGQPWVIFKPIRIIFNSHIKFVPEAALLFVKFDLDFKSAGE